MRLKILFLLILTSITYSQTTNWQKIIPNTEVAVQYYFPEKTNKFLLLNRTSIVKTQLGSVQTFQDKTMNVVLSFRKYLDYIELSGEVDNLKKNDLCFTVKIIFPFGQESRIYWNGSPDSSVLIKSDFNYNNYVEVNTVIPPAGSFNASEKENGGYGDKVGIGEMSFYPIASISNSSFGLGWGIDLGIPVVYRLSYKPSEGIVAEFDLATALETKKFPNRSFFKIQLFEHSPDWHFRSALNKYYKINPEYFKKRVIKEGIWLPFTPLHSIEDYQEFGFTFHETDWRTKDTGINSLSTIEADNQAGVHSFQYTQPWDIEIPIKSLDLNYKDVTSDLTVPPQLKDILQNSALYDKNNLWQTRKLETPWFKTGWAVSITTNADPEISGINRYDFARSDEIDSAINLNVDGIYFDSMEWNWHNDLNYNRKYFSFTDYPLTFSASLKKPKPAIWNYSSEYKMMNKIASEMHSKGKLMMGNGFGWMPFAPGILDLFGAEISLYSKGDSETKKLQFNRAISYQKPIVFLLNEGLDDRVFTSQPYDGYRQYFEKMLSYGFFPSFFSVNSATNPYWEDSTKYNTGRPFFKKYIPLIKLIAAAGWEPITYAITNTNGISIERFGYSIKTGLYFTIFNNNDVDKEIEIFFGSDKLNLPEIKKVNELITNTEYTIKRKNNDFILKINIPYGSGRLLKIY